MINKKIIVVGCGSIGARHLKNLFSLRIKNLVAVDLDQKRLENLKRDIPNLKTYKGLETALRKEKGIDAGFVCTPTSLHIPVALKLAEAKINLFIEKPLSHNLKGVLKLVKLVKGKKLITMMGMNYRFHPGLKLIKQIIDERKIGKIYSIVAFGGHYLPDWHPNADYRKEYAAQKKLGGGVLLTSIHGLDYLRWLVGEPKWVFGHIDKVSNLEIDVEDVAFAFFETDKRIKVSIYTDFLQRVPQHGLDVIGEKGTIKWNFYENKVDIYDPRGKKWISKKFKFETNDMYIDELKYFLYRLKLRKHIEDLNIEDGAKTLQLALAVKTNYSIRKYFSFSNEN
ncbi:MAG: Oxidoreductase domain-containing protein [Berkelbacteria bacterium GW2011_GWA1_36_9]|uniref:Oxidoreductase domain-containing protein n=1 Tax=Berkelbacteria bacterium GW2011_GWA1_36_9 TaxID=1618331 RepID=A0A0G0I1Q1_9BACT|nr:MAG: Oxidoreductase domain-containing protein [Berkelbacteria bacterium GW2011_GWA1_36_9]